MHCAGQLSAGRWCRPMESRVTGVRCVQTNTNDDVLVESLLSHNQFQHDRKWVIRCTQRMTQPPMEMDAREQIGTCAKTRSVSAKPLHVGSIPTAASTTSINSTACKHHHSSHILRLYHCRVTNVLTNAVGKHKPWLEMLENADEIAPAGMNRTFSIEVKTFIHRFDSG